MSRDVNTLAPAGIMAQPSSELLELIVRAAELRAAGRKWEAIAAELERRPGTVRRWPSLYPEAWRRSYREAEDRVISEGAAEAMMVLRNLLRATDDKVRRDAARHLVSLRLELRELENKAGSGKPASGESQRIADFLDDRDEEQIESLVEELTTRRRQEQSAKTALPA